MDKLTPQLTARLRLAIQCTLTDVRVEMTEEFDRNFTRQAFFTDGWARKAHDNGKPKLIGTGTLRRSIGSQQTEDSVVFFSTEKYALIHNNGGEIKVTSRMKKYFWYRYIQVAGKMTRTRAGTFGRSKKNLQLGADAEFFKAMALKKVGSKIAIPRRQFIGMHPQIRQAVQEIIERNFNQFFNHINIHITE